MYLRLYLARGEPDGYRQTPASSPATTVSAVPHESSSSTTEVCVEGPTSGFPVAEVAAEFGGLRKLVVSDGCGTHLFVVYVRTIYEPDANRSVKWDAQCANDDKDAGVDRDSDRDLVVPIDDSRERRACVTASRHLGRSVLGEALDGR